MPQKTKGVLCILLAAFGFAMMSMFIRLSGPDISSFQKAFFRNLVALILVSLVMIKDHTGLKPDRRNIGDLFYRAFFGTLGLLCNFYAIDHLVLADATMLNKLSPFFAIIISIFLLKEKPSFVQMTGVFIALGGSMLIIKPSFSNPDVFPAFMGLLGGLGAGAAYTFVRKLGFKGENSMRIIFYFSAFSCLLCLPYLLFSYDQMTMKQLIYLICAGCFAAIGQFGITKAYLYAPAKEISVYDYTQVIFAALLGLFLFDQIPDFLSVIGYLLICGAGIGMFLYNKKNDAAR